MQVTIDPEVFEPVIRKAILAVIDQFQEHRLALNEEQAAALVGLRPSQLRDERRRGRVAASILVGRRSRYSPADLRAYLERTRQAEAQADDPAA
jgi:hypothetical protein